MAVKHVILNHTKCESYYKRKLHRNLNFDTIDKTYFYQSVLSANPKGNCLYNYIFCRLLNFLTALVFPVSKNSQY